MAIIAVEKSPLGLSTKTAEDLGVSTFDFRPSTFQPATKQRFITPERYFYKAIE